MERTNMMKKNEVQRAAAQVINSNTPKNCRIDVEKRNEEGKVKYLISVKEFNYEYINYFEDDLADDVHEDMYPYDLIKIIKKDLQRKIAENEWHNLFEEIAVVAINVMTEEGYVINGNKYSRDIMELDNDIMMNMNKTTNKVER